MGPQQVGPTGVTEEQTLAAYRQQLVTAGVADDPVNLLAFLQWQVLRAWGPLREMAANEGMGPIPLAAAHATEGLQRLLGICQAGQNLTSLAAAEELPAELEAAREALTNAVGNVDILRTMVGQNRVSRTRSGRYPVGPSCELAFDVHVDGAEEVDVLAVYGGDVAQQLVVDAPAAAAHGVHGQAVVLG